jgi:hypothetical protein
MLLHMLLHRSLTCWCLLGSWCKQGCEAVVNVDVALLEADSGFANVHVRAWFEFECKRAVGVFVPYADSTTVGWQCVDHWVYVTISVPCRCVTGVPRPVQEAHHIQGEVRKR